jgi:hypothetical protein
MERPIVNVCRNCSSNDKYISSGFAPNASNVLLKKQRAVAVVAISNISASEKPFFLNSSISAFFIEVTLLLLVC